jgi:DNA-binding MarR family transcriptional regulator
VIAEFQARLARLADAHTPEFLEVDITMSQAKVLYLLSVGDLSMSELVARLGVTLPTVSGVVDRLADRGLIARHADASDRRRVFVGITPAGVELLDRFRDLNSRQVGDLLAVLDDAELEQVRRFLAVLDRGISRLAAAGKLPGPLTPVPQAPDPVSPSPIPAPALAALVANRGASRSSRS